MQNICIGCIENNNGWCKKLQKNGNKKLTSCAFRSNNAIEINWQAYALKPRGIEVELLGPLLAFLEKDNIDGIKKLLDTNGLLRK